MKANQTVPILKIEQFDHKISTHDFYSNTFENHIERNGRIINKPHSHNFFLCVFFIEGSGMHEIDFNTYNIQPGSVFFLKPGQTHFWNFNTSPKGYIFFHTQEFYEFNFVNSSLSQFPFYFSIENPSILNLSDAKISHFKYLFQQINEEHHRDEIYKYQKLTSLIDHLYIDLTRYYTASVPIIKKTSKTYLKILENFLTAVEEHFKTEKSVQFYSDKLNITSKHLNRVVKTTISKTSSDVIKERVLLEAKRMLVHSTSSLSSISELLGFEEYSYFSKTFKANTGCTPFDFRKKY